MTTEAKPRTALAGAAAADGPGATERAVSGALSRCPDGVSLVLSFCSGLDPDRAASALADVEAGVPRLGMTGKGSIAAGEIVEHGCVAIALSDRVGVGVGVRESAAADLREAARDASRDALDALGDAEHRLLLLLLDTPNSDHAEAVAGAYDVAGPSVPLAGGGAGGPSPALLHDGAAIRNAVVAVALAAPNAVGLGTAHGCEAIAAPSIVTRSEGLKLTELDGRPASEVYLERLGYADVVLSDEEFEALAVTHPLAQPELNGDTRLRHVRWREEEALACATHLPPGAAVEFTQQGPDEIVAAASRAVSDSLAALDRPPRASLIFDCAGRKGAIGSALGLEHSALISAFGEAPPLAGAFTYGEIARSRGAKGDRNHAVVVATLA